MKIHRCCSKLRIKVHELQTKVPRSWLCTHKSPWPQWEKEWAQGPKVPSEISWCQIFSRVGIFQLLLCSFRNKQMHCVRWTKFLWVQYVPHNGNLNTRELTGSVVLQSWRHFYPYMCVLTEKHAVLMKHNFMFPLIVMLVKMNIAQ